MATVDLMLQGKGGVGKTYSASSLAQYYLKVGKPVICIDADPTNATLAAFAALKAQRLNLLENGEINSRIFDELVEIIAVAEEGDNIIIDNGASSFVSLLSYILNNKLVSYLTDTGHRLRFHTIIAGGPDLEDTALGFDQLCNHFPESRVVVWQNAYLGKLERDGKTFEDSRVYKSHESQIDAIITHQGVKKETFGADVEQMLKSRLTFEEAISSPAFSIMSRQRLKLVWDDVYQQLVRAGM